MPTEYELFLDRLLDETHGDMTGELRSEMKRDLYGRLQSHMLTSYMQALPDDAEDDLAALMHGEPDADKIQTFFRDHIAHIDEVTAAALLEFRDVYMNAVTR